MHRIKIITPDPIVEKLLTFLTEKMTQPVEDTILLDAAWLDRISDYSGSRIIAFTASADPAYLTTAQSAGADGFWYLHPSGDGLAEVIAGEQIFSEKAPSVQMGKVNSTDLTARELDVLRELVTGKTDAEIGNALNLAIPTVKHHVQQLFFKTGLANRTQLAVAAVRCGLIRAE